MTRPARDDHAWTPPGCADGAKVRSVMRRARDATMTNRRQRTGPRTRARPAGRAGALGAGAGRRIGPPVGGRARTNPGEVSARSR
ncbi:MAG: hypothetical protein ACK559_20090 [bacterium]